MKRLHPNGFFNWMDSPVTIFKQIHCLQMKHSLNVRKDINFSQNWKQEMLKKYTRTSLNGIIFGIKCFDQINR